MPDEKRYAKGGMIPTPQPGKYRGPIFGRPGDVHITPEMARMLSKRTLRELNRVGLGPSFPPAEGSAPTRPRPSLVHAVGFAVAGILMVLALLYPLFVAYHRG